MGAGGGAGAVLARPAAETPIGGRAIGRVAPRPAVEDEDVQRFFLRPRIPPLRNSPAPSTNPKLYQVPLLWTS